MKQLIIGKRKRSRLTIMKKRPTNKDETKASGLIDFDEIDIPTLEIIIYASRGKIVELKCLLMLVIVFDGLAEDLIGDVGQRDSVIGAIVMNHVLA